MVLERRTLLLLSHLVLVSCVNDNIMVRDYFMHKGVSSIVGFSCGSLESAREKNTCIFIYKYVYAFLHYLIQAIWFLSRADDVKFAKTLNDVFVLTAMWNFNSVIALPAHTVRTLLQTNYRNLGVYVDARCDEHNYTVIYSEVKKMRSRLKKLNIF